MNYGKILQWCKNHLVSIGVLVGLLVLVVVGVRACKRNLDIDINATRNRIIIEQRDSDRSAAGSRISKDQNSKKTSKKR